MRAYEKLNEQYAMRLPARIECRSSADGRCRLLWLERFSISTHPREAGIEGGLLAPNGSASARQPRSKRARPDLFKIDQAALITGERK